MHVRVVHEGQKPFNCPKCSKSFGRKAHLKIHVEKAHNTTEEIEIKEERPVDMTLPLFGKSNN